MTLNEAIKKADILGLIDYLENSPEYGEPTETGTWLFQIRFDLIQLMNITTNQEKEKNQYIYIGKKYTKKQIQELDRQMAQLEKEENNQ